jgi:TolB-like protein/class 3 adenylate cyclase
MTAERYERKLIGILSADVKGYSRLMGEDEEATIHTLTAYREVMANLIQKHQGLVVDSPGDNVLAQFKSVVDAVRCAVEIQEELKVRNTELPENRKMEFRIGVNLGDVIEEGERIYGDGVNIAARVEGLAEGGGISISGTVHDHIEHKLALGYEFLGEHTVKNIKKPVRVYRVLMEPGAGAAVGRKKRPGLRRWQWAALAVLGVLIVGAAAVVIWNVYFRPAPPVEELAVEPIRSLELPDKPSIAVLPFVNMSGDPEQEYFSDGITEDLITDLSKISGLFVIARNSVFVYKGKGVKTAEVGRELGVRYVLEGSVRKANDRVRITAQLVDANTGGHLWAERYDRDLKDIFALQDEVTQKIVAALAVKLTEDEQERLVRKGTDSLEAYDFTLRGWDYFFRFTMEANAQAREMFERAIDLAPQYALGHSGLGLSGPLNWRRGLHHWMTLCPKPTPYWAKSICGKSGMNWPSPS